MKNLTFVIQGPVSQTDVTTLPAVISVRTFFPQSPIIISTWGETYSVKYLEDNLTLVHNSELPTLKYAGDPWAANFHRQIRTVVSGLNLVKTEFSCKLRTDCYFTKPTLRKFFEKFVTSEKEYLQVEKSLRLPFYNYSSDWFQISTTTKMQNLWSRLDQVRIDLNWYREFPKHCYDPLAGFLANYHPEQMVYVAQFGIRYVGRHYQPSMYEYIKQRYRYRDKIFLVGKQNIGLDSTKYPNKNMDFFPIFLHYRIPFLLKLMLEILIGRFTCLR